MYKILAAVVLTVVLTTTSFAQQLGSIKVNKPVLCFPSDVFDEIIDKTDNKVVIAAFDETTEIPVMIYWNKTTEYVTVVELIVDDNVGQHNCIVSTGETIFVEDNWESEGTDG